MRIAILNALGRPPGGVGSYLRMVIPALAGRGHDIAFWHEYGDRPAGDPFRLPTTCPSWSVERIGLTRALDELRAWRPHVLVSHGLLDPAVEARTLQIAPAVLHSHAYHGTCISGAKTFKSPTTIPCSRRFGWPCLVNYYPRRCGGWSPVTMVRQFRGQAQRFELLFRYKAIVVYTAHLQREYARHGLQATCLGPPPESTPLCARPAADRTFDDRCQLLFVGRMDPLKGGTYLLDALPDVAAALEQTIDVTFAGDGPARQGWQKAADSLMKRERGLRIDFAGWLDRDRIDALLTRADLLVLPSVWPEPFGLVGLEAGRNRLPVAAFAVGGIPDWLTPGVNGYLAPGNPPTARGLADAIIACLKDPVTHARLRDGAARVAGALDFEKHIDALLDVLSDVAGVSGEDEDRISEMTYVQRS
jgi:glycosyltransferase involved in cell wall biosynthesis